MTTRLVAIALPLLSLFAFACSRTTANAPKSGTVEAPVEVRSAPSDGKLGNDTPAPLASSAAPLAPAETAVGERADERAGELSPSSPAGAAVAARKPSAGGLGRASVDAPVALAAPHSATRAIAGTEGGDAFDTARGRAPIAPRVASPSINAGEWDDNANYREFVRWLATEDSGRFHPVDVAQRRFLVVRDLAGKAVARCPVTVADEAGHKTTLTTSASGRAILFPRAEGLTGRALNATATCEGSSAQAGFSLGDPDGVVDLKLASLRASPGPRTIDVAFILDTTGSMSEEILAVKSTVQKVASSLEHGSLQVNVRVGLVAYKDRGDEYVTQIHPMTTDLAAFQRDVSTISAGGGGDMPESVNEGIHTAVNGLAWNPGALAQFAFLIGDAPPHLDYAQDFDYAVDMKTAAHRGIQIFTVAASGMDDVGQVVWRQVAEYTNATNLFVLRGGAGPQSTGAGDPKSSCGGTHDNYTSGQLDALILGKIRYELGGVDRDPLKIPGLGADENTKPCAARMIATE